MKLLVTQEIRWTNSIAGELITKTKSPGTLMTVESEKPEVLCCRTEDGDNMIVFRKDIRDGKVVEVAL